MDKKTAKKHLEFVQGTLKPLVDEGKEDRAVKEMEDYCERYPDLVKQFAKSRGHNDDLYWNFEPSKMKTDIEDYTDMLKGIINKKP